MQTMTNFTSGGTTIPAELYNPAATPNGGVVVILYGSDGMSEPWTTMIQGYANALCLKGFIAIIPDYFIKTRTKAGDGFNTLQKIPLHRDTWQTVVADAATMPRRFQVSTHQELDSWVSLWAVTSVCGFEQWRRCWLNSSRLKAPNGAA